MTWPRIEAMFRYWDSAPPVHVSVASYMGWKESKPKSSSQDDPAMDEFLASFPMCQLEVPSGRSE